MDGSAIKTVVKDYLNKEHTDYALMIDGVWGSGKSFFVENDLARFISNTDCLYIEPSNKHIPIIYSLYGAESAEKIQLDIKWAIKMATPKPDSKKKKIFQKFHHSKAEAMISAVLDWAAGYCDVENKHILSLFNLIRIPKNIVLILDDLERSKTSVKEVLAIVNKYTEREKIKVIVICNETKEYDEYKQFKEKTIRYTLHYSPSTSEKFDSITKDWLKNKSSTYQSFIVSHKSLILDIFRLGDCTNLRTLIFVLDIFEKIFKEISHRQFADDFCKGYLLFTCIYSIEYKSGACADDLAWLACHTTPYTTATIFDIARSNYEKNDEAKNPFFERISRYGDYLKSTFSSKAIAHYIQHGDFDKSTFEAELKKEEDEYIEKNKTEYGQCLLKMMDWRKIDDSGLDELLSNVENFINQDLYSPRDISVLYARYLELKINNISCRDIGDTVFFEAINRKKDCWTYVFEEELYKWEKKGNSFDSRYEKIKQYIIDINKEFRENCEIERNEELLNLIRKGNIEAYRQYTNRIDITQFLTLPVGELWEAVSQSDKDIQHLFVKQMLELFHMDTMNSNKLGFIEKLLPHMRCVLTGEPIIFSMMKYKSLAIQLQQILRNTIGARLNGYILDIVLSSDYPQNAFLKVDSILYTFSLTDDSSESEDGCEIPLCELLSNSNGTKEVNVSACYEFGRKINQS